MTGRCTSILTVVTPAVTTRGWLTCLPRSRSRYQAEQEVAAGVGAAEAFGAGFTHHGPGAGAGARGFASGGLLDLLEPGPVLGLFLDQARAAGMPAFTEDELVGVMCAAERQSSWDQLVKLEAITDLDRRRTATAEATGDHRGLDHFGDEIAAALTLTGRAAARLADLAAGTARLPAVGSPWRRGGSTSRGRRCSPRSSPGCRTSLLLRSRRW